MYTIIINDHRSTTLKQSKIVMISKRGEHAEFDKLNTGDNSSDASAIVSTDFGNIDIVNGRSVEILNCHGFTVNTIK